MSPVPPVPAPSGSPEPFRDVPEARDLSSEELARRAQLGSRDAFGELVLRHEGSLLRFLRTRLPSECEAEEVAQEAFLRAWRKLALYDPEQRFATWLFTLARHLAVSRGRARRLALLEEHEADSVACASDPGAELARRESGERLWKLADDVLTRDQREALWLRYAEDLSAEEIGAVLGKRDVAVRVLLFRARETLARHLEREPRASRAPERAPNLSLSPREA
ncbi:MAG: sigma-70 family RNA polymerase sigma factor [Planctomycetes bacterium]|nr:sigma-70 family RNA polymerase sigma factor [Planctomycetota bacterium]